MPNIAVFILFIFLIIFLILLFDIIFVIIIIIIMAMADSIVLAIFPPYPIWLDRK